MHLKILIGMLCVGLVTASPKADPKPSPKASPQFLQGYPGAQPNYYPGAQPNYYPGAQPNYYPGAQPNYNPSAQPNYNLGAQTNYYPGVQPNYNTGAQPNYYPGVQPNYNPSAQPNYNPSVQPNYYPGVQPNYNPSAQPNYNPSVQPNYNPSVQPNYYPGVQPNYNPTAQPNYNPSVQPNYNPSAQPNYNPSAQPNYYSRVQPNYSPSAQPNYYPSGSSYFGQEIAPQPTQGPPSAGGYGLTFSPTSNGAQFGNAFGAQQVPQVYSQVPQPAAGNYYQPQTQTQPQPYPVPVPNPGDSRAYSVPVNQNEGARLWPKQLISPVGSPSPIPDHLARAYYAVSTPSTLAYAQAYYPITTPAPPSPPAPPAPPAPSAPPTPPTPPAPTVPPAPPAPLPQQPSQPIPVPVKVYNPPNPPPVSTPASLTYQRNSNPAPAVRKFVQPTGYSFSTTSPPTTKYQPATRYNVGYQSSPAPFKVSSQQSTQSTPAQVKSNFAPVQVTFNFREQSVPVLHSTPAPSQSNDKLPAVSSDSHLAASQQPTPTPYVDQHRQTQSTLGAQYQQPTASPFSAENQRIPVPVGYPQNQYEVQQPPSQTVSVPVTSRPITVVPTTPPPDRTVTITENTFIPIPTSSAPASKPLATIVKSEYNAGTVSPQYNHIPFYSSESPFEYSKNAYLPESGKTSYQSYAPMKTYAAAFSPSTSVSHVSYNDLHHSYSY